jgi:alkanesulfonate monooxygenase SsuD/methylene tetrahydromethanopterin reductase-like flavin-dependent oxidoreductase (luciferase family)
MRDLVDAGACFSAATTTNRKGNAMATTAIHPLAASDRIRFAIETAPFGRRPARRQIAQAADDLGFEALWLPDRPMAASSAARARGRLRRDHPAGSAMRMVTTGGQTDDGRPVNGGA